MKKQKFKLVAPTIWFIINYDQPNGGYQIKKSITEPIKVFATNKEEAQREIKKILQSQFYFLGRLVSPIINEQDVLISTDTNILLSNEYKDIEKEIEEYEINLHKKEQKRVQKEKDFVLSIINYNCCQSIAANNFYDKEEERHNREIRRSYNKIHKNKKGER